MLSLALRTALALSVATSSLVARAAEPEPAEADAPADATDAAPSPGPVEAEAEPSAAAPSSTTPPSDDLDLDPLTAWRLRLDSAIDLANEDPKAGADGLAAVLSEAPNFTVELANDPVVRAHRNHALLVLARAYLTLGDEHRAGETIFEAQRSAGADPLNPGRLGPSLTDFYNQQQHAASSGGRGGIAVECTTPCRVYLNEHPAPSSSNNLLLGPYRLVIVGTRGDGEPLRQTVALTNAGETAKINYPARAAEPAEPTDPATRKKNARKAKRAGRMLPQWLEISAIVGGAAAIGAGAALVALDAGCVGQSNFKPSAQDPGTCTEIYNTRVGAFTAIGIGAFALLGGVITLSVDASRAKAAKNEPAADSRSVFIGYTRRF
ncbi:MAG: hypothetical protein R3B09_32130 [Nannocystaceae bacterium]